MAEGASFSYQVKVNDTVGNKDLTNTVVHTVDNPGAKPASSKYTVAIKGACPAHRGGAVAQPGQHPDR